MPGMRFKKDTLAPFIARSSTLDRLVENKSPISKKLFNSCSVLSSKLEACTDRKNQPSMIEAINTFHC